MSARRDRTLSEAGSRWPSRLPPVGSYGIAVLSVSAAAALVITWQRYIHIESAPASLLFCAVMLSAWLGGLGVGLLATALSILALGYYVTMPDYSLAAHIASAPRLVVFALAALFVCSLAAAQQRATQSLRKARDDLASKVDELENANRALQTENAQRRRTEGLLRESELRLRALVGSVDEIVFELAADGTYLNIWTRDESLLVRPRSELIGRRASEVMDGRAAREYLEAFGRVLASERAETLEYPLRLSAGKRWFLSRISPIHAADGSCRTVSVLARDVTERKRGEQRLAAQYVVARVLAESENLAAAAPELLRGIGDSLEWQWGALWVVDRPSGRLSCHSIWHAQAGETAAFDAISRKTDFAPGQGLVGRVWQSAEPVWIVDARSESEWPRARAAATVGLRGAVAFPILLDREVRGVVEFFDRATRQPDQEQLAALSAVGSQIGQFMQRRRAEATLQESEKRFRALIDHSSDAILMVDREGTIRYASPSFERVLGYAPEEAVGRNSLFFVDPDQHDDAAASFAGLRQEPGKFATLQSRTRHKDGSLRWLETTVTNWLDEPAVQAVVANVRDITERKLAEEALQRTRAELAHISRVTTLGEITASIAHEVNQPLAAVVTNASAGRRWLAAQPPNLQEARDALDRIVRDGNRASDIINRIRALLNKSETPKQRLSINEIALEVLALTRNELHMNRVALNLQLADDLPLVAGDRVQLQQVILNLIVNAIEAMRGQGAGPRELLVSSSRDASGRVRLTVKDSGPGLDPAGIDRLFDAFYTTKQDGMGMGLAISRSIVEAHGGRLWAMPNAPRGAIFHLTLQTEENEEGLPNQAIASSHSMSEP